MAAGLREIGLVGSILQKLLGLLSPAPQGGECGVYLAAFGKHPGWDDHIDDVGLETERLTEVKRKLYVEGIGGNIDAGSWEELEQKKLAIPFHHVFAWRFEDGACVGRLWASQDGKGRSRYPMIVCAHCPGLPLEWALYHALPRLERVEADCRSARTAVEVRAAIATGLRGLREAAEAAVQADADQEKTPMTGAGALGWLASRPEMGPEGNGLLSVLYQIDREMADFTGESIFSSGGPSDSTDRARAPQPLRVPACTQSASEAAWLWIHLLLGRLAQATPILAVQGIDQNWVDLIVGEATAAQLYCMRALPKALPLTTDIPYTVSEGFRNRAKELIDSSQAEGAQNLFPVGGR